MIILKDFQRARLESLFLIRLFGVVRIFFPFLTIQRGTVSLTELGKCTFLSGWLCCSGFLDKRIRRYGRRLKRSVCKFLRMFLIPGAMRNRIT